MQKLVKTGKYTEINKQSNVKFWLNWIKFEAVSYLLSCTVYTYEDFAILKVLHPPPPHSSTPLHTNTRGFVMFKFEWQKQQKWQDYEFG